jgi:hypothetical protein
MTMERDEASSALDEALSLVQEEDSTMASVIFVAVFQR